jgi:hypothetical protein
MALLLLSHPPMLVSGKEVQALPSSSPGHDSFQTGKNHISQEKWIEAAKSFIDAAIFILSSMGKEEAAGESKRREEVGLCYHTAGYAMSHINEKPGITPSKLRHEIFLQDLRGSVKSGVVTHP